MCNLVHSQGSLQPPRNCGGTVAHYVWKERRRMTRMARIACWYTETTERSQLLLSQPMQYCCYARKCCETRYKCLPGVGGADRASCRIMRSLEPRVPADKDVRTRCAKCLQFARSATVSYMNVLLSLLGWFTDCRHDGLLFLLLVTEQVSGMALYAAHQDEQSGFIQLHVSL